MEYASSRKDRLQIMTVGFLIGVPLCKYVGGTSWAWSIGIMLGVVIFMPPILSYLDKKRMLPI